MLPLINTLFEREFEYWYIHFCQYYTNVHRWLIQTQSTCKTKQNKTKQITIFTNPL